MPKMKAYARSVVVCKLPTDFMMGLFMKYGYEAQFKVFQKEDIEQYIEETIDLDTPIKDKNDVWDISNCGFGSSRPHDKSFEWQPFFVLEGGGYVRADTHLGLVF